MRKNPLHRYRAPRLKRVKLVDLPRTARGPWAGEGMESRFREKYLSVPLDIDVVLVSGLDFGGDQVYRLKKGLHDEALYQNHIVLFMDVNNSEHASELSRDEAFGMHPSGAYLLSPLTPFMMLHNLYETAGTNADGTMYLPIQEAKRGIHQVLDMSGYKTKILTKAGKMGRFIDTLNAAADLFAAYLITGRVQYADESVNEELQDFFDYIVSELRARPGVYTVQTYNGSEAGRFVPLPQVAIMNRSRRPI